MVKFANLLPGGEQDAKRFLTIAMQVLTQKPDLLRKSELVISFLAWFPRRLASARRGGLST